IAQTLRRRDHRRDTARAARIRVHRRARGGAGARRAALPRSRRARDSSGARCRLADSATARGRARVNFFDQLRLLRPGWRDAVEILLVSYVIYRGLLLLHRSRAVPILVGIVLLFVVYAVA